MKKNTVNVIGGGLAGLYAAHQAAIKGMQVTLYEKNKIGTKHNCGELFTEIYTSAPEECKISRIETFIFIIDNEEIRVEFGEKSPFIMTDKNLHESIMKDKCIAAGVNILEKTVALNDINNNSSYIIDAGGVKSYTGKNLGKAMTLTCGFDSDRLICKANEALFILRKDCLGYAWAFPKNKLYNIGDGVYNYKQKAEVSKNSIIEKFSKNAVVIHSGGGLLPMPDMLDYYNTINNNSTIKVGNAAGLINTVLGGGEHLAVLSGMLAGELVSKLTYPTSKYYEALDCIIGDEMRFGISLFEHLKNKDGAYIKEFLKQKLIDNINIDLVNKNVRKNMAKWIEVDNVKESELIEFIGD